MEGLLKRISRYRLRKYLDRIRTKKPSLVEYYAMYLTNKKLEELSSEDIERAERGLVLIVLKYYLNPSLTWEQRIKHITRELEGFYLYFCHRKKYWNLQTSEELLKVVRKEYSVDELIKWCRSPVPRTKYAFSRVLEKTKPGDILRGINLGLLNKDQLLET